MVRKAYVEAMILTILAFLAFLIAVIVYNVETTSKQNSKVSEKEVYQQFLNQEASHCHNIEHDGHTFILYRDAHKGFDVIAVTASLVHHPDCRCKLKAEIETFE
jgi:hypothetical protein